MRNSAELRKDLEKRHHQLLKEAVEHQQTQEVAVTEVNASEDTSLGPPVGIGPCLLADAFSCEVCLGSACVPFASRPRKTGGKNKASGGGPFVVIKNALTAKATEFKISCTACTAIQPGEKISFELEMFVSTNFADQYTLFTSTKIGVDAKTCIGPGSPLRVLFDTLGLTACISNFKATYLPFLGDLSIEGRIPGPVFGTLLVAKFDTDVHDPPTAVWNYCGQRKANYKTAWVRRRRWFGTESRFSHYSYPTHAEKTTCFNNFKALAGPLTFSAAVAVPLIWGGEFEIVKVSGPHSGNPKWKVELFQMPFDKVAEAIKKFWDNTVGPAVQDALNAAGEGVKAAGKWTVGAANAAGKWTVGAAKDVGKWGAGAAKTVAKHPVVKSVVKVFSGFR